MFQKQKNSRHKRTTPSRSYRTMKANSASSSRRSSQRKRKPSAATNQHTSTRRGKKKSQRHHSPFHTFFRNLFFLLGIAFIIGGIFLYRRNVAQPAILYKEEITQAAEAQDLDPLLVAAVIRQESQFDANAISRVGAQGLMQIMPETQADIARRIGEEGDEDILQPATNLRYGCWYLRYLLNRFDGEISTALAGYNAGPNIVEKWLKNPNFSSDGRTLTTIPYPETSHYVENVMAYYQEYQSRLFLQ